MIVRAKDTFAYTEEGPKGLLKNKKVYLVAASGGVPAGSEADFTTTYLRFVLGFIGITDVTVGASLAVSPSVDRYPHRPRALGETSSACCNIFAESGNTLN